VLAAIALLPKVNGTTISPMNVSTLEVCDLMGMFLCCAALSRR
jgi:hypothetical protein